MNSLSWFLYLADVLPSLGFSIFMMAIFIIVGVAAWVFYGFAALDINKNSAPFQRLRAARYYIIGSFIFCVFVPSLIPSKQTIYLIAGSEAGEAVVTSEEGKEIISDIKKIIKLQLKEMTGDEVEL